MPVNAIRSTERFAPLPEGDQIVVHNTSDPASPTAQAYGELQTAYDFFSRELFPIPLPPCLITMQRKSKRTFGYYSPKRFATASGETTDEIAINPRFFKEQTFIEIMSTLVHEMVHLWQHHFGKPSRSCYHNRQWAGEMLRIGLRPSNTGKPGGRMTGQQMMEYVIPGGRFEVAAAKLIQILPGITWFDVNATALLPDGLEGVILPTPRRRRRITFQCPTPGCGTAAVSQPATKLLCGHCHLEMEPVDLW